VSFWGPGPNDNIADRPWHVPPTPQSSRGHGFVGSYACCEQFLY